MPVENLNLQIIIPKINEIENYQNALKNINKNTKDIEMILNIRETNDTFKKVNSTNNIEKDNMLVIDSKERKEKKNKYQYKKVGISEIKKIDDDIAFNDIGQHINIKI
ncbi:MAG: hypothetical protein QME46_10100 [Thermoanaerobacteraceae bacterium]|nr:hypothetical protein [Thermoanaerobacteraceae bacterium]